MHGAGDSPTYKTYNKKEISETFPFPKGLTPNVPAAEYASDPCAVKIAAAAARLNDLRVNWLKKLAWGTKKRQKQERAFYVGNVGQ